MSNSEQAAVIGHGRPETAQLSLARLRREVLVTRGANKRDPRWVFRCVNRLILEVLGGRNWRQRKIAQFAVDWE